jgi:D-alanyl-D-alanine carboxypeptidase
MKKRTILLLPPRAFLSRSGPLPRLAPAELATALGEMLREEEAADRFSGAVLLGRVSGGAGNAFFREAYGLQDRARGIRNAIDTRFRIGSMNKMFTAVAVLQLVQAGRVQLDDPVGNYLADYPNPDVATRVTIHHLLTHTGGTGDIFGPEFVRHREELRTLADYAALYGKRVPAFEPGSRFAYSNYGMILLGLLIERVSGQSYYDNVSQHVYAPAGMVRSGSEPENEGVAELSIGYMKPAGATEWTPNTSTLPYRGTSAGGGYSTVDDLFAFATALLEHRLLSAENTALLITGKVIAGSGLYAYGFGDQTVHGVRHVGHAGGAPGMSAELRIYPETGYVSVVLSNLDPPAAQQVGGFIDLRIPAQAP